METLFLRVLDVSIAANWLIAAVLILRVLLCRAPKWTACLMWGLAGLRLALPLDIHSPFSLIPSAQTLPPEILHTAQPQIQSGIDALDAAVNPALAAGASAGAAPMQRWMAALAWVWAAGAAVLLLYALVSWLALRRRLATATLLKGNVRQSERVKTPFVLGLIRPTVYLPYHLDDADRHYVLAHEQAHIRRGDHIWKPLAFVLAAVYWFDPLVWLGYVLLGRDIEAACDEKVIRGLAPEGRRGYSVALLHCSTGAPGVGAACPLAFGEVSVKQRIRRVMNYRRPAFWVVAAALAAAAAVAVCLLTVPLRDSGSAQQRIVFPTGEEQRTQYNQAVFDIPPFALDFTLPQGWQTGPLPQENAPLLGGLLWCCTGIYDENHTCVGAVGYNTFEWMDGAEDEPMMIYNQIALGNDYQFAVRTSYRVVETTDTGETALADVLISSVLMDGTQGGQYVERGILAYDRAWGVYVAFELDSDLVSEQQALQLAGSLRFADAAAPAAG